MIALALTLIALGGFSPEDPAGNQDLLLTVKIVRFDRYCASGPDFYQLQVRLELIFTNHGSRTLILQKRSLGAIEYWRLGETEQGLMAASWAHLLTITNDSGDVTDTGGAPDEQFAVIKPGRAYKAGARLYLSSKRPLAGQTTLLQVIAPTWSGTSQQAEDLREKWKRFGVLWFGNVRSQPSSFTLDNAMKIHDCS